MSTQASASPQGSVLRNRFFQTVLLSNMLLQLGIWIRNFAVLLYVTDKTGNDPVSVSLISVAEFAPIFVFSFVGGTFADRWRPKRTMIWCDLLSAISVFAVLLTLIFETWEAVYFATFVSAILSQFSQPSGMKLFKRHIQAEQQQTAMAMFQSLIGIFMVVGPSIGVFVYQTFGIETSIAAMGVAFLLSAAVLLRIPENAEDNESAARPQSRVWHDMKEGFAYVRRSFVLRTLGGVFALAGLASGIGQTLRFFIVTERLQQSKDFLQFVMLISGIAMLVGGAAAAGIVKKVPPQKLLAASLLINAVSFPVIGFSTNVALTLVFQFLGGLTFPVIQISISTMMLQWSEQSYIGRVNGVLGPMFVGMMVIMMASAGTLKTIMPLVTLYSIAGGLMLCGALLTVTIFKQRAPEQQVASEAQPVQARVQ